MSLYSKAIPAIRPITDLRAQLNDVLAQASSTLEPIILTKNGSASCAIMSIDALDAHLSRARIALKLREAEIDALYRNGVYSEDDMANRMREVLRSFGADESCAHAISDPQFQPKSHEVMFSEKAADDIECVITYIAVELKDAKRAAELGKELLSFLANIAQAPRAGKPFRDVDIDRVYHEARLDDLYIYYTIEHGVLTVWRILDPQRNIDRQYSIERF